MYCPSCGNSIPDESTYCLHCGKQTNFQQKGDNTQAVAQQTITEWEYDQYVRTYGKGKFGILWSSIAIAANYWQSDQINIMVDIRKWIDEGWEPITAIGPEAYIIKESRGFYQRYIGLDKDVYAEFRVKFRRQKNVQNLG